MKKSKKIILRAIPFVFTCLMLMSFVFCNGIFAQGVNPNLPDGGQAYGSIQTMGGNVWSTITLIAQIAAFAAIVFAGVRYMFASADAKADIKKQTVILVVGAILVFGASTVVSILINVLNDIQP